MDFRILLGTSNKRRLALLENLYYRRDGWSSDQLMSALNCSLPILLNDIELINEEHPNFQISKNNGVYHLVVDKTVSLSHLYANILNTCPEFQIISELLYEDCENITALAKKLYLSTSNTQRYLKKIEKVLIQAGMELYYRPLRIEGSEGEIRNFYYRFYKERQDSFESTLPRITAKQYNIIENYVEEFVTVNGIWKKYIFQKRLVYNFYISLWRIKNGHPFTSAELRTEGVRLPLDATYKELRKMVNDLTGIELTPEVLRDCLWLVFSDAIVFSSDHRELAMADNPKYRELFMQHYELVSEFNQMLGSRLTRQIKICLTRVLSKDFYLYDPAGRCIGLLWRNRSNFLREVSRVYLRGVEKIRALVDTFVEKHQIYQEEDFVRNYVYLLITKEKDALEWLASQDQRLKVLLLSDLTPTEEDFLAKQIQEAVYGNFSIIHFEQLVGGTAQLQEELKKYDCLITTGSAAGLPKDFPVVVIDPFLTPQLIRWIQEMISDLAAKKTVASVVE